MAVTQLIPKCQKLKLDVLYVIVLNTFNTPLESVQNNPSMVPLADFLDVTYVTICNMVSR